MTRPAFLVDGQTEQKVVQRICPSAAVRIIGANGRDVDLEVIATRTHSLINLLGNRYYPVIVIVDREGRQDSCVAIRQNLLAKLVKLGVPADQLLISVSDRMFENWIAAGHPDVPLQDRLSVEGQNGVVILKRMLEKRGESYNKATDGVKLFCEIDINSAVGNSSSFREFAIAVRAICSWINDRLSG